MGGGGGGGGGAPPNPRRLKIEVGEKWSPEQDPRLQTKVRIFPFKL